MCQEVVAIPQNGVNGLQQDMRIQRIEESLRNLTIKHERRLCEVCKKLQGTDTTAKKHCGQCRINLCLDCADKHVMKPLSRDHVIVHISHSDSVDIVCKPHGYKTVAYFCKKCNEALCPICAEQGHENHDIGDLRNNLDAEKELIENLVDGIGIKLKIAEDRSSQLTNIEAISEHSLHEARTAIQQRAEDMIRSIKQQESILLAKLKTRQDALQDIRVEKETTNFHVTALRGLHTYTNNIIKSDNPLQILAVFQPLSIRLRTASRYNLPNMHHLTKAAKFAPSKSGNVNLGQLEEVPIHLNSRKQHGGQSDGLDETTNSMMKGTSLVCKINMRGARPGEPNIPTDAVFLPNGDFVVADRGNYRLKIFNREGNLLQCVGEGELEPWSVAITKRGCIVVTDRKDKCIKVYTTSGELVGQWGKFMWPTGIAVNRFGQVIVTDTGPHCVSIHSSDGKLITQFGSKGSGDEQFNQPSYVCVDSSDNLIISVWGSHCIKVFDARGQFLHKFGTWGRNEGQMMFPHGVCVDQHDNVLVAESENNRVCMFSPDGSFLRTVLTSDQVHAPWAIALNHSTGQLLVTESVDLANSRIKLFQF